MKKFNVPVLTEESSLDKLTLMSAISGKKDNDGG